MLCMKHLSALAFKHCKLIFQWFTGNGCSSLLFASSSATLSLLVKNVFRRFRQKKKKKIQGCITQRYEMHLNSMLLKNDPIKQHYAAQNTTVQPDDCEMSNI